MSKRFLYIASSPSFCAGKHQIKVGISNDPKRRILGIKAYDHLFKMVAIFQLDNPQFAHALECMVIGHFYRSAYIDGEGKRIGKEFFYGDPKMFISFVKKKISEFKEPCRRVL